MQTQKGDMTIALDIGIAEQVCGKASDDDAGGGACPCGQACIAISWDSVGHEVAGRGAGAVMVLLAREVP